MIYPQKTTVYPQVYHSYQQLILLVDHMQLILGFLFGALIALLAWRSNALSTSGALAAALSGGIVFGLGGFAWAAILLTFFISSSILSRICSNRKASINEKFAKGHQRDWGQVLANGSLGTLLVIITILYPEQNRPWVAYVGAMAAVNADTWATELGILNPGKPRLITSGKSVEKGSSGGISLYGYLAAFGGAALIGFVAVLIQYDQSPLKMLIIIIIGGLVGSTADSILGATIQAIYSCPNCSKETERYPLHTCGTETMHYRGWRWLNNDWVNFICSLAGGASTLVLYNLLLN